MPSRSLSSLLVLSATLGAGSNSAVAQGNPIVGTWKISFAAGTRIENGTPTTITGTGSLVVQLQGDSLIARLIPDPIEGAARPEARMAAPGGAGKGSHMLHSMLRSLSRVPRPRNGRSARISGPLPRRACPTSLRSCHTPRNTSMYRGSSRGERRAPTRVVSPMSRGRAAEKFSGRRGTLRRLASH